MPTRRHSKAQGSAGKVIVNCLEYGVADVPVSGVEGQHCGHVW